jgi:hypothetical protein
LTPDKGRRKPQSIGSLERVPSRKQRGKQAHLVGWFDFPPIFHEEVEPIAGLLPTLYVQLTFASETANRYRALYPCTPPHGQRAVLI